MDMSLDDIIQKKRQRIRAGKVGKKQPTKQTPPARSIIDARNKIISKNRTQIFDARQKLSQLAKQKDARFKLEHLRNARMMSMNHSLNPQLSFRSVQARQRPFPRLGQHSDAVFLDPSRQVSSGPYAPNIKRQNNIRLSGKKTYHDKRSIGPLLKGYGSSIKPILRTVENDDVVMIDATEETYEPTSKFSSHRTAALNLKIITSNDACQKKNIRKTLEFIRDSSPRPQSILKQRPKAVLRLEKKVEKPELPVAREYRIIVSNLRSTVTGSDIEELFGDIGGLQESRLVRPGTAEVIYKKLEDAQRAVDLYHNRQLDGQAMNCLLVNCRPSKTPLSGGNGLPPSSSSNVEPDLSTFHKVLFSNF